MKNGKLFTKLLLPRATFKLFPFIFLLLAVLPVGGQDQIFRKSGKVLKGTVTGKTLRSRSYRLMGEGDSLTHFLNVSLIDSILYQDGKKEIFTAAVSDEPLIMEGPPPVYDHFVLGLDAGRLISFGTIPISFELLTWQGKIGFKTIFSFGTTPDQLLYYNYNGDFEGSNYNYFTTWTNLTGMNGYLFPGKVFRAGTGFYWLSGRVKALYQYYDEQTGESSSENETESIRGILWSILLLYKYNENIGLNLGFDTPLYIDPLMKRTTLRLEVLLTF